MIRQFTRVMVTTLKLVLNIKYTLPCMIPYFQYSSSKQTLRPPGDATIPPLFLSPLPEQSTIGTQWLLQRECDGLCMLCLYLSIHALMVQCAYSASTNLWVWTWYMKLEWWDYRCMTVAYVTAVSHHEICTHMCVHVYFAYLPLLICRGEWRRWSDGSGLSGERDRLPRPWDRLEWFDVSEYISEMSVKFT